MRAWLVFVLAGVCCGEIIPEVTRTISSDVPGAQVTIYDEQSVGNASVLDQGDHFELQWNGYVEYKVKVRCSPDPALYCSEWYAQQTTGDPENLLDFRHYTDVTYKWTIPLLIPGSGPLVGGGQVNTYTATSEHVTGISSVALSYGTLASPELSAVYHFCGLSRLMFKVGRR
jgi:hypothetical protein